LEGYEGPVVPGINMVYIPFSQLEIKDSWYVTGMKGTGSDTSVAKDVFVPDHLMVMMDKPFGYVEPGKKHYGAPSDSVARKSVEEGKSVSERVDLGGRGI